MSMKKTDNSTQYMAKIIVIGNSSVGKTSIVLRYTWNGVGQYELSHTPTIGLDFKTKVMKVKDKQLKLQIWDTAGQERFRNITDSYYHGVSGIILVYSVEDRKSFQDINEWMFQVTKKADENIPKIIIANKCQLGLTEENGEKRMVESHEGKMLAEKYKSKFLEVSAKENINIEQIFTTIASDIMKGLEQKSIENGNHVMVLKRSKKMQKSSKIKCCQ